MLKQSVLKNYYLFLNKRLSVRILKIIKKIIIFLILTIKIILIFPSYPLIAKLSHKSLISEKNFDNYKIKVEEWNMNDFILICDFKIYI